MNAQRIVQALLAPLPCAPATVTLATRRSVTLLLAALYAQVDDGAADGSAPCEWRAPTALTFHRTSGQAVLRWALPDATHVQARICGAQFEVEWQQRALRGTHCTTTLDACADFVREILAGATGPVVG